MAEKNQSPSYLFMLNFSDCMHSYSNALLASIANNIFTKCWVCDQEGVYVYIQMKMLLKKGHIKKCYSQPGT